MPWYKLYYFQARARAEAIRSIFKQAGVAFEDVRIEFTEEWPKFKPKTPYGSMPVLEVDGKMLAGAPSIQRYLAEEFGLAGSNALENAQLDSIVGVVNDFIIEFWVYFFEKDETKKEELWKKLTEEASPKYLGSLEKLITPDGWVFGSKVTYADFVVYNILDCVRSRTKSLAVLDKYPKLQKHRNQVEALPNIAKWLKERPESEI